VYSFHLALTLSNIASENLISIGLIFHSKGMVAFKMIRELMSLDEIPQIHETTPR